jgi:hypothetical protein
LVAGARFEEDQEKLKDWLGQKIELGTAISAPWCFECTVDPKDRKGKTLIYSVKPPAKA